MITEHMKEQLVAAGLSKQQANSATAEAVINFLMNEDEKTLIHEARLQVNEMRDLFHSLRIEYFALKEKIDATAGFLLDIAKAQEEHGALTDDRAKNAITLYATILNMNERVGAKGSDSVDSASYAVYAYLGGQARRDIHYNYTKGEDNFER